MQKQPLVKERTRALFIEAFWLLFRERSAEQIKIGELSAKAGFNRSTFYEYFTDIYDLLHQAEDELIEEFKSYALKKFPEGLKNQSSESMLRALVEVFDNLGSRLMLLIGEKGDPSFQEKLRKQVMPFLQQMMGYDYGKYADYVSSFSFSGLIGVLKYWHQNQKELSEEELISLLISIISNGIWSKTE